MITFLDMDGVLVDFIGAACRWYRVPQLTWDKSVDYKDTVPIICEAANISVNHFWNKLDESFWADMPLTNEGIQLLDYFDPTHTAILSSPSNHLSAHGKMLWIKKNVPELYARGNYFLGRNKVLISHNGNVLIDDDDNHVNCWYNGIVFPQVWNTAHSIRENKVLYVLEQHARLQ